METKELTRLVQVGSNLGEPKTIHENLALAGNLLIQPLAGLRARQAALEVVRAKLRHGASSDLYAKRAAEAEAATLTTASIGAEVARLSLDQPVTNAATVGAYGYVTDGDTPVTHGEVELVDDAEVLGRAALGDDGSFSVSAKSENALSLRVTAARADASTAEPRKNPAGKTVRYTDPIPILAPGPVPTYRVVDLAKLPNARPLSGDFAGGIAGVRARAAAAPTPEAAVADKPKPAAAPATAMTAPAPQPAAAAPTPAATAAAPATKPPLDPAAVAGVPGSTLNQGLKSLADQGVAVTAIRVKPATETTPKIVAVSTDPASGSVALEVHARNTDAAKMDVLATVLTHDPDTDHVGMTGVDATKTWLRDNSVSSFKEAQEIAAASVKDIRTRFEIGTQAAGRALKRAFNTAIGKIEHEE